MNRIKQIRKEKGITVKDLADKLGIAQSMLTNYENGGAMPRNSAFWEQLAGIFGVSVGYLMGVTNTIDHSELFDPDAMARLSFIVYNRESVCKAIEQPVEVEVRTPERYALLVNIDQLPDDEIEALLEHVRGLYQGKYKGKLTEFRVSERGVS